MLDGGKFPYRATAIDLASRHLVDWAVSHHVRTELVTAALAVTE
ncbi:hypothetical protein [Streptomyces sp. NPDC048577]